MRLLPSDQRGPRLRDITPRGGTLGVNGEKREVRAQPLRRGKRSLDEAVGCLPYRIGRGEQRSPGWREDQLPAAFVLRVGANLDETAAHKRLERGSQRRAVHA